MFKLFYQKLYRGDFLLLYLSGCKNPQRCAPVLEGDAIQKSIVFVLSQKT